MAINVSGKNYPEVTPGTVQAVCYGVWDLGFQKEVFKQSGEEKIIRKVVLGFEVNEKVKEGEHKGKRLTICKEFSASLGKKANLRKELVKWRGKDFTAAELNSFDIEKLKGANAYLSITKSTGGSSIIGGIAAIPPGMPKMKAEHKADECPKWVKDKQAKQVNEDGSQFGDTPNIGGQIGDDEDPFGSGDGDEFDPGTPPDPNDPGF